MSSEPGETQSFFWYWPHACRSNAEGIRVKISGWEGDSHYTGDHHIPPEHADFPVWKWIHAHRLKFPPLLTEPDFARLTQTFHSSAPEPMCPEDGFYLVAVPWSGPAVATREALEKAHKTRPLPRPLKILDGESAESSQHFPHLTGLLHGWGELFGFSGGKCDVYQTLGKNPESLPRSIEQLYE